MSLTLNRLALLHTARLTALSGSVTVNGALLVRFWCAFGALDGTEGLQLLRLWSPHVIIANLLTYHLQSSDELVRLGSVAGVSHDA